MIKIYLRKIKKPETKCVFLKMIVCVVVILSTNLLSLHIIAESNPNDTKTRTVGTCRLGEELVEPVTKIINGNNVTFTNTAFEGTLYHAVFNGTNQFQYAGGTWVAFPGEKHRYMHAEDRLFQFYIYDRLGINMTALAAGVKFNTVIGEVYEVTLPYQFEIFYARGNEYQNFYYELFNSNQASLKKGSVPLIKHNQTGTVNFTFTGTGTTVGLAFGIESTSELWNDYDQRLLYVRNPSVKMKKQIQQIFSDVNLAQVVADKLGKQITDFVTKEELDAVQDLTATNKSIQNLSGIECLKNIQNINFSSNQISDLSPLSGLTNLNQLRLGNNQISDLSPLSSLNQLTILYLENNQISHLNPLSEFTKLNVLNLNNNQISNLNPLSGMKSLNELYLNSNQISEISVLAGLTQLTTLSLEFNQINDVSPLSGVTNLSKLYLGNNQIRYVNSLSGLTRLTILNLSVNQISDISTLKRLINIVTINLANQSIQLSQGTIRVPTSFSLSNPNGSIPPIIWLKGTGTYENSQLIWSTPGDNKFTWSNYVTIGKSGSDFNGQVSQYTQGFLYFKKIPDSINFETTIIPSKETIIHRDESNWEMSVYDELPGRKWHITTTIDTPLTSTSNSSHKLLNALVYVDDEGNPTPLSTTPLKVFEYTTGADSIILINWERDKGILVKINPSEVYAESYTTTINWTLTDAP